MYALLFPSAINDAAHRYRAKRTYLAFHDAREEALQEAARKRETL